MGRQPVSASRDKTLAREGLDIIAGSTRGTVLQIIGNGDGAFGRLSAELSGYYLLGFEPESGDRDGKPHKIKVALQGRSGVTVRARNEFAIDPPTSKSDDALLKETLQSPMLANERAQAHGLYPARSRKQQAAHPHGR